MKVFLISLFCFATMISVGGCTSEQLRSSTVNQANTVTDIQYQQVLNNIAAFCLNLQTLPSGVIVKNGSTQVGDSGNIGFLGVAGLDSKAGLSPTISGSRTIVDQWGTVPITDDNTLTILRMAYQNALGWPVRLSVSQANDMAHDLSAQVGTNADISVDSDTLRTVVRIAREKTEPSGPLVGSSNKLDPSIKALPDSKDVKNPKTGVDAGSVKPDRNRADQPTLPMPEDPELKQKRKDAEERLEKEPTTNETDRGVYTQLETQLDLEAAKVAMSYDAVSSKINDTLDEEFMTTDPSNATHFVPKILDPKSRKRPATGLAKETIRRINDIQDTFAKVRPYWFHVSYRNANQKHFEPPIPKVVCYKGFATSCGRECCVWVCADAVSELAEFTLLILHLSNIFKDTQIVTVPSGIQFSPSLVNPMR